MNASTQSATGHVYLFFFKFVSVEMGVNSDLLKTEFNLDVDVPIRQSRDEWACAWGGVETSPIKNINAWMDS